MATANSGRGLKTLLKSSASETSSAKATKLRAVPAEGYNMAFPVYVTTPDGTHRGIARSFGPEGMFIETREPDEIGTQVSISFVSPYTGEELILRGWVRSRCTTDIDSEQNRALSTDGSGEDVPMGGPSQDVLVGMGIHFSASATESMKWSCALKAVLYPVH